MNNLRIKTIHNTGSTAYVRVEPSISFPDRVFVEAEGVALSADEARKVIAALEEFVAEQPLGEPVENVIVKGGYGAYKQHVYFCEKGRLIDGTLYFHEGIHVRGHDGRPTGKALDCVVGKNGKSDHSLPIDDANFRIVSAGTKA